MSLSTYGACIAIASAGRSKRNMGLPRASIVLRRRLLDFYLVERIMQPKLEEYLRRNLLHAASVGVVANSKASLERIKRPKWLIKALEGIIERAERVEIEMARHRDELNPHRGK